MIKTFSALSVGWAVIMAGSYAAIDPYSERKVGAADETVAYGVEECLNQLGTSSGDPVDKLNPGEIELLNWNIKKGSMEGWHTDLRSHASGKDLVLLQEVDFDSGVREQLEHATHESFSQGYTNRLQTTGVATYSASAPISKCHLVSTEPLMRTPKATSVTEYDLSERDETLLVVNIHAVVSLGLDRYREQMDQVRDVVASHQGPAILSGDFNTWREKRIAVVDELVRELAFTPVVIDADYRTKFNNNPLDHVFVRGLTVEKSQAERVSSSDHNPILVKFRL